MDPAEPDSVPPPSSRSPDRWARKWAIVASLLLVAWFLVPTNLLAKMPTATWSWTDLARSNWYAGVETLLPVVVAAVVLGLGLRGAGAAWIAWIAAGGALLLGLGLMWSVEGYFQDRDAWKALESFAFVVGAMACAAVGGANHVRKRRPRSRAARLVCGIGGIYVVLFVLVLAIRYVGALRGGGLRDGGHSDIRGVWLAFTFVFGLLATLGLRSETRPTARARVLGWMAVSLPALSFLSSLLSIGRDYPDHGFAWFLREAGWVFRIQAPSTCGGILLAVGLASWIERRSIASESREDPTRMGGPLPLPASG